MRMQVGCGFVALCLLAGIDAMNSAKLAGEDLNAQSTIRVDDIGRTVKVIGRLGCPLREMVAVRGTWVEPDPGGPKPDITLRFRVTRLDGKQLDRPVEFYRHDVTVMEKPGVEAEPVTGEQWELRAYETWPIGNHPPDYWKELGVAPASPPPSATRMFGVLKQRTAK